MKKMFFYSLIFSFASCAILGKQEKAIKFKYYKGVNLHTVKLKIPGNYSISKISTGGEGQEYRIWYPDSSLIYISDAKGLGSVNERFFREQPDMYSKRFLSDSATFYGVDELGNFWKEVKCCDLFWGYHNVKSDKKALFDNVIQSAKHE